MTEQSFSELLAKRNQELAKKSDTLNRIERAELKAIQANQDKKPSVTSRIRCLSAKLAEPTGWKGYLSRFSKKNRQNLAELKALIHYGKSPAVWEIAYLSRKRVGERLTQREVQELNTLFMFHDSPDVLRITYLKMKEAMSDLTLPESRELARLLRNPYRKDGVPEDLISMLWEESPSQSQNDMFALPTLSGGR